MLNLLALTILLPLLGLGAVFLIFALTPVWSLLGIAQRGQRPGWDVLIPVPAILEPEDQGDQESPQRRVAATAKRTIAGGNVAYYIALATSVLTLILVAVLMGREPVTFTVSSWHSSLLFDSTLMFRSDTLVQPLVLALAVVTCCAFLVGLVRSAGGSPLRFASTMLALLAAGLAALWAANLLTALIVWTIYDFIRGVSLIATGGSKRDAVRSLIFSVLATLLLWGGTLLGETPVNGERWTLVTLSDMQTMLWGLVAILRLAIYPFHLSATSERSVKGAGIPLSLAIPLFLSPVIGWTLLLRVVSVAGGRFLMDAWVLALAVTSLAVGGFLAWSARTPRRSLPWVGVAVNGAILLSAGFIVAAGQQEAGERVATIIAAGCTNWALGVTALFGGIDLNQEEESPTLTMSFRDIVRRCADRWWRLPSFVGALTLSGFPLTLGFVTMANLMGGFAKLAHLWWLGAYFVGQMFMVAALVRILLSPISDEGKDLGGWKAIAGCVGTGGAALLLVITGMYPQFLFHEASFSLGALLATPSLLGWLLWVFPFIAGGLLGWQDGLVRPKAELALNALHNLTSLEWFYSLVIDVFEQGLIMIRMIDRMLSGAGALLWSWILFLIMFLFWRSK